MSKSMAVQTDEEDTHIKDAELKDFLGKRTPSQIKEPPTRDTKSSKKKTSHEDIQRDDNKGEACGKNDPLDTFANIGKM